MLHSHRDVRLLKIGAANENFADESSDLRKGKDSSSRRKGVESRKRDTTHPIEERTHFGDEIENCEDKRLKKNLELMNCLNLNSSFRLTFMALIET